MRLFVAVWPPADLVDELRAHDRPAVAGVRWTTEDQWHVTLRFLGDVPELEPVAAALRTTSLPPPFISDVGPATSTFRGEVLHVPVSGLAELAAAVTDATAGFGRPPERRPFRGHLTLARSKRRGGPDLRPLAGAPLAGEWPVEEVTLVHSTLTSKGATYSVVERVALQR